MGKPSGDVTNYGNAEEKPAEEGQSTAENAEQGTAEEKAPAEETKDASTPGTAEKKEDN